MPLSGCKSNSQTYLSNLKGCKKGQMWIKGLKSYLYTIKNEQIYPIVDLDFIKSKAVALEAENLKFQAFLRNLDSLALDKAVFDLSESISPKIECTHCGNCCKSLMVNIDEAEANNLSAHLGQTRAQFDESYLSKGESGRMVVNAIPCHFLVGNSCSVYEHRFAGCKEFPAFHVPEFNKRLFTTYMHYDRCPIIFNVMETLKKDLEWQSDSE
jgi:Fe-S-cluster containining protein